MSNEFIIINVPPVTPQLSKFLPMAVPGARTEIDPENPLNRRLLIPADSLVETLILTMGGWIREICLNEGAEPKLAGLCFKAFINMNLTEGELAGVADNIRENATGVLKDKIEREGL